MERLNLKEIEIFDIKHRPDSMVIMLKFWIQSNFDREDKSQFQFQEIKKIWKTRSDSGSQKCNEKNLQNKNNDKISKLFLTLKLPIQLKVQSLEKRMFGTKDLQNYQWWVLGDTS